MTTLRQRLDRLDAIDARPATIALLQALSHALDDERDAIVEALIRRPGRKSLEALVAQWDALTGPQRDAVALVALGHPAALKRLARSHRPTVRLGAVEIIARHPRIDLADLVLENLDSGQPDLAGAAAWALDSIALAAARAWRLNRDLAVENPVTDEMIALGRTVAAAMEDFPEHRQIGVLSAAQRLAPLQTPAISALLDRPDHPAMMAFRGFLKHLPDDQLTARLLPALLDDHTADQALEQIKRLARSANLTRALSGHRHLLRLPIVHKRLQRLNRRTPPVPSIPALIDLDDPAAQVAMARWIGVVPMHVHDRIAHLAAMFVWPDTTARLAALRELIALPEVQQADDRAPQVTMRIGDAIAQFCFDADERIARIALRCALVRNDVPLTDLIPRLLDSPHPDVRAIAARARHEVQFNEVWNRWDQSDPAIDDRLLLWSMLRADRAQVVNSLRARVATSQRQPALRALRLARDARLEQDLEIELLQLAASDDAYLSATAVSALGRIRTDSSRSAVLLAVRHADGRTRSNAIDALGAFEVSQCKTTLDRLAATDANRPRSAAIAALCHVDRELAHDRLTDMLRDKRPLHRISALWTTQVTGMIECGTQVADLASADPIAEIRKRATATAGRLVARLEAQDTVMPIDEADIDEDDQAIETAIEIPAPWSIHNRTRAPLLRPASALALPIAPLTLVQSSTRLREISDSFMNRSAARGSWWQQFAHGDFWFYALGITALITIAASAAWLKARDEQRFGPAWRDMARYSRLSPAQRRALNRAARAAGWQNPIAMLISRGAFEYAVAKTNPRTTESKSWRTQINAARGTLWQG